MNVSSFEFIRERDAEEFSVDETHGFAKLRSMTVIRSSAGLRWRSAFVSVQAEDPYVASFSPRPDILIGVVNSGSFRGRISIRSKASNVEAPPGAVTILPNGASCDVDLQSTIQTTHVYIRRHLIHEAAEAIYGRAPDEVEILPRLAIFDAILEQLCWVMRDALEEDGGSSALYVDQVVRTFAAYLLRHHSNVGAARLSPGAGGKLSERTLRRVRQKIEARLSEPLTVAQLAEGTGLGADHFGRLFKQTTGLTLYQFVTRCRVGRAQRLLSDTRMPTAAIALECGFSDQVGLTRAFRRVVGTTPAAYRSERQK